MEVILFYGFDERLIRPIAERYGFALCRSLDELGCEDAMLVQPEIIGRDGQLAFFDRMMSVDDRIGAVIATPCDTLGLAHYSSAPGKFFTAAVCDDDADTEYELCRIIESRLGLLSAHEGIEAPGRRAER